VAGGVSCQRQIAILRDYLDEEILPHAEAEERSLCRAAVTPPLIRRASTDSMYW
jgi:hypothetical protein